MHSIRQIFKLSHEEFSKQATELQAEPEAILDTVDGILDDMGSSSLSAKMDNIWEVVGTVVGSWQFLADRQPTSANWDKLFHYAAAYKRNKGTANRNLDEFVVNNTDRAQVDRDKAKQIQQALMIWTRQPQRARHTSPNTSTKGTLHLCQPPLITEYPSVQTKAGAARWDYFGKGTLRLLIQG